MVHGSIETKLEEVMDSGLEEEGVRMVDGNPFGGDSLQSEL